MPIEERQNFTSRVVISWSPMEIDPEFWTIISGGPKVEVAGELSSASLEFFLDLDFLVLLFLASSFSSFFSVSILTGELMSVSWYHLSTRPTIVLFPLPDGPTMAVFFAAGIVRLSFFSTVVPG